MQPIELQITGLNSYVETQVIDFDQLTTGGLFGIFGPTGSGKSTILDAITLAMYGMIPRNTRAFINTYAKEACIAYTFSLQHKAEQTKYRIDRSLRRQKNGGYTTSKALLRCYQGDEMRVIAERAREVNQKVVDIIGLSADDFVRSVVLPQGKFDEFLRLSGLERRNMLERLFALEAYGKALTEKIRMHLNRVNEEIKTKRAALAQYQGVTTELYEAHIKTLTDLQLSYAALKEQHREKFQRFDGMQKSWTAQQALGAAKQHQQQLESQQNYFNQMKLDSERIASARLLGPYIDEVAKIKAEHALQQEKLIKTQTQLTLLNTRYQVVAVKLQESMQKVAALPEWVTQQSRLQQAVGWQDDILSKQTKLKHLAETLGQEETLLINIQDERAVIMQRKTQRQQRLSQIEKVNETLQVDPVYRNRLQAYDQCLKTYQQLQAQQQILQSKKLLLGEEQQGLNLDMSRLQQKQLKIEASIQEHQGQFEHTQSMLNDKRATYQLQQQTMSELKSKYVLLDEQKMRYATMKLQQQNAQTQLQKASQLCQHIQADLLEASNEREALTRQLKHLEKHALATILAEGLQDGEPCPVCGSRHHETHVMSYDCSNELNQLKVELASSEEQYLQLQQKAKEAEQGMLACNFKVENIAEEFIALEEKFSETLWRDTKLRLENNEEVLIQLQASISSLEADMQSQQRQLETYRKQEQAVLLESRTKNETIRLNSRQIKQLEIEQSENLRQIQEIKQKIDEESFSLSCNDVENMLKELIDREQKYIVNQKERQKISEELQQNQLTIAELTDNHMTCQLTIQAYRQKITFLNEQCEALKQAIERVCSDKSPEHMLQAITDKIKTTQKQHVCMQEQLEKVQNEKRQLETTAHTLVELVNQLVAQLLSKQQDLQVMLTDHAFSSVEEVRIWRAYLQDEYQDMLNQIQAYQQERLLVAHRIKTLSKQCGTITITETDLHEMQNELKALEADIDQQGQKVGAIQQKIKDMEKDLNTVQSFERLLNKATARQDLLIELNKLVKGNRFVAYVALRRLKYVAQEASLRLRRMTHGRYVLELDEDGSFVIRDDFQGGARRPCNTLSGGEVFLTSLALALALSSQIQLKGHAPLEFFFLDEGFGSLDNELLDSVISALEQLHHDTFSVGIISHVQSLQERLPVKLMVTPAEQGGVGSKVHIEVS